MPLWKVYVCAVWLHWERQWCSDGRKRRSPGLLGKEWGWSPLYTCLKIGWARPRVSTHVDLSFRWKCCFRGVFNDNKCTIWMHVGAAVGEAVQEWEQGCGKTLHLPSSLPWTQSCFEQLIRRIQLIVLMITQVSLMDTQTAEARRGQLLTKACTKVMEVPLFLRWFLFLNENYQKQ